MPARIMYHISKKCDTLCVSRARTRRLRRQVRASPSPARGGPARRAPRLRGFPSSRASPAVAVARIGRNSPARPLGYDGRDFAPGWVGSARLHAVETAPAARSGCVRGEKKRASRPLRLAPLFGFGFGFRPRRLSAARAGRSRSQLASLQTTSPWRMRIVVPSNS